MIRKVTMEGNVKVAQEIYFISGNMSTFAGSGRGRTEDGIGVNASFNVPIGITLDEFTGDVYVSEFSGNVIRRFLYKVFIFDVLIYKIIYYQGHVTPIHNTKCIVKSTVNLLQSISSLFV